MLPLALGVGLGLLVAAAARTRARCVTRVEDECATRLPLGPDGVVVGASAFALVAGDDAPAVLLVHGAGDTPQTLRYLADDLHARGFTVYAPLLPGHGRAVRQFAAVSAEGWLEAVRVALDAARARHAWVGIVGLSLGGALAVRLAAERPELPAVGLIAPYLAMPALVRGAARSSRLWGVVFPYVRASRGRPSILDPVERQRALGYGYFTPAALRALRATVDAAVAALPRVRVPALIVQSRDDNRIPPDAAERAFARLGAAEKVLRWVGGAHVLTVDTERAQVFDIVATWLEEHGARPAPRQHAS
ncbi:MAG TPA: alpha/beta fold hydrolase [Gemmatimonadaceae bacterium]|nr:alpha/beta fold hydrolase [Gemmatimonadaceae bacterium]